MAWSAEKTANECQNGDATANQCDDPEHAGCGTKPRSATAAGQIFRKNLEFLRVRMFEPAEAHYLCHFIAFDRSTKTIWEGKCGISRPDTML
jgi:hypothetical protein